MKLKKIIVFAVVACMLCTLFVPSVSAADDGLLIHYTFDDAANPGHDSSGNGHDATVNGAFTAAESGKAGGAVVFDGAANALVVEGSGIGPLMKYTTSVWLKITEGEREDLVSVCSGHNWEGGVMHMTVTKTNQVVADVDYMWNQWLGSPKSDDNTVDGEWKLITIVADFEEGMVLTYVNGALAHECPFMGTLDGAEYPGISFDKFTIGAWNSNDTLQRFFLGEMDDFRLYDRCLSADEVKELAGDSYVAPPDTDPVTEPDTDPVTDPVNDGTAAPKPDETGSPAGTDAVTDGNGNKGDKSGCGSTLGMSAAAVMIVSVLGVSVIKKKR